MNVQALNHVNIRLPADELRVLRDFYCDVLGLVDGPRPPFRIPGYWLYAGEQAVLHLAEVPAAGAPTGQQGSAIDHVAFTCQGFDDTLARLDGHGLEYSLAEVPETDQRQIFLRDPAGLRVELNFTAD